MLLNCGVGEDSWESLGLQGDPASPSKGYQSWTFIGRTDAEAESPILWPPDMKKWLSWKDPDAGKDWRQEKGTTKDEMVGWYHWINGHEFQQTPSVGNGQGIWRAAVHGVTKSQTQPSNWNWRSSARVGCHFLLQGISVTQGWNPHLLRHLSRQVNSLSLCPPGSPYYLSAQLQSEEGGFIVSLSFQIQSEQSVPPSFPPFQVMPFDWDFVLSILDSLHHFN